MKERLSKGNRYSVFWKLLNEITNYKWETEVKFHPTRKWAFDFAQPQLKIAIEIDGGVFSGGRHSGGIGQLKDMEKMNNAIMLGWVVLHFTPDQTKKKETFDIINATISVKTKKEG